MKKLRKSSGWLLGGTGVWTEQSAPHYTPLTTTSFCALSMNAEFMDTGFGYLRLLQELLWPHILTDAILLFLCCKLSSQLHKWKLVEGSSYLPNNQVDVCQTHLLCRKRYEPWFTFSVPRQSIVRRKYALWLWGWNHSLYCIVRWAVENIFNYLVPGVLLDRIGPFFTGCFLSLFLLMEGWSIGKCGPK